MNKEAEKILFFISEEGNDKDLKFLYTLYKEKYNKNLSEKEWEIYLSLLQKNNFIETDDCFTIFFQSNRHLANIKEYISKKPKFYQTDLYNNIIKPIAPSLLTLLGGLL